GGRGRRRERAHLVRAARARLRLRSRLLLQPSHPGGRVLRLAPLLGGRRPLPAARDLVVREGLKRTFAPARRTEQSLQKSDRRDFASTIWKGASRRSRS